MPDLVIAARDASPTEKASADIVCYGRTYLPLGQKGGCTAAFMVWGRREGPWET